MPDTNDWQNPGHYYQGDRRLYLVFWREGAIAIQAMAEWIRRQRARAPAEEGRLEIDQILKIMIEKSAK